MKTIKDFTPEIQNKIPTYINNALTGVFDGKRYNEFNLTDAENAVNWNYLKCGFKKPIIIVAENIYEQQLMFNYIKTNKNFQPILQLLYNLKNNISVVDIKNIDIKSVDSQLLSQLDSQLLSQLDSQLRTQLSSQLDSQLDSQLYSQLDSQLSSQLYSQLFSQLSSQLDSQLDSQLYSQLRTQLDSQLSSQLNSQLFSQLSSQLNSQLYSQLFSQLSSQLRTQLSSQLDSQLYSQLFSQLSSQLDSQLFSQLSSQLRTQLDSQLYSQLRTQLRTQLYSQLNFQLDSQLDSQLRTQLDSQLDSQLFSQLRTQLRTQLYSQLSSQLFSQLDSQLNSQLQTYNNSYLFTLNVYSDCYYAWFKFIKEEFNLPLTIEKDFEECFNLQRKSNIYSAIFSDLICVVSKYPKKVYRNVNNLLHNRKGNAVEWGFSTEETKFNSYYINGRNVASNIFNKVINKELKVKEFINEENEDTKAAIYEIMGEEEMMKFLNTIVVDSQTIVHNNGDLETIELIKTINVFKELNNKPLAWIKFKCPSTNSNYHISTNPDFNNAIEAAKFHRPFQDLGEIEYSWNFRS